MRRVPAFVCALIMLGAAVAAAPAPAPAPAAAPEPEDLARAWRIALESNQRLRAEQSETTAAGLIVKAAQAARLPTLRNFTFNSNLTESPRIRGSVFGTNAAGGAAAGVAGVPGRPGFGYSGAPLAGASAFNGQPASFSILGRDQTDLPVSITFATVPLYTGGRILGNIEAARSLLNSQRTVEFRAALDLKLAVAEAYIGVLRARRNLQVARGDVEHLASFAKDVRNRRRQGLAIRSDELAAQVSLGNARIAEIRAATALESAWTAYNRHLHRPLTVVVELAELVELPPEPRTGAVDLEAILTEPEPLPENDDEVDRLTELAFRSRPELADLAAQAQTLDSQARVATSGVKPHVSFIMSYAFIGNNNQIPQGIGAATFLVDWTMFDGGQSRRRAAALRRQEDAALQRRADVAAEVAREVRTRWLELRQARLSIPVARLAVVQSIEALRVASDRYGQQLGTYTEVLDAEARRVQSLTNFYSSIYDESTALFRLRRAIGNL